MLRYVLPIFFIAVAIALFVAPSVPLDRPKASDWPGLTYAPDAPLTGWEDPRLRRSPGESALAFATRATDTIHTATYHCDVVDYQQSVTSYAIIKLGLLAKEDLAQGLLHPSLMRCGFCHQRAFILARVLDRNGIADAHVLGLVGHVVTAFEINGYEYVSDPDFGVHPFRLDGAGLAERVDAGYTGHVSTDTALEVIKAGYADPTDNGPYNGGLSRLEAISEKQAAAAGFVTMAFQLAGGAFVLMALVAGALGWKIRTRKKSTKLP